MNTVDNDRLDDLERRIVILEMRLAAIDPAPDADGWISNGHPDDEATLALIREKYGSAIVGEPKATEQRTVEALKADNIIGIYVDLGDEGMAA